MRISPSTHRDLVDESFVFDWIFKNRRVHFGAEETWADRIDIHSVARPLERQYSCEVEKTAFGRSVRCSSRYSDNRQDRANIDNSTPTSLAHTRR